MRIPAMAGIIDRRILVNFKADKDVVQKLLPARFRPKLRNDKAVVGICLIRLKHVRPKMLPFNMGISSENGAHRIAVEWNEKDGVKEGVYIPRRDTSSRLNHLAGGNIFPGVHHLAAFSVREADGQYDIAFDSDDGTFLKVSAKETSQWNEGSVFEDKNCASDFFRQGSVGYSPTKKGDTFEGLELHTKTWDVSPLSVSLVRSSFFEDESLFPKGSITFDNALLMRNVAHEWNSKGLLMPS